MRIEGGSLRCTAELAVQVAGDETARRAASAAPAAAVRVDAQPATDAAARALTSATGPARPAAAWLTVAGEGAVPLPSRGYAAALPPATAAAPKATVSSPLDFLRDSRLTAEEKLVLLLAQQQKDVEKEIDTVLKKAEAKSAQKQKSSGGVLGGALKVVDVVKRAVPGLGLVDKLFGEGTLTKAVRQLGGPIFGAAVAALGAPALLPLASAAPGLLASALDAELPFGSSNAQPRSTASNAPNAGAGSSTALDPVETQRLTLLVNRQQQWASTVSNLLHGLHQTRMSVIQNLR